MTSVRRVTVFGGSGFIGRYVVQRLTRKGAVVAVVAPHASDARTLLTTGDVGQVVLINGSPAREELVARSLEGADAAVNLMGILSQHGRQRFDTVHHRYAETVARLAAAAGVEHLVQVSAIGADPNSPSQYARSKAAGEAAVLRHFPTATILRPSVVFGPEDDFFNRFARMAQISPFIPLIGGGTTKFQPVYVGDVANAVLAALDTPAAASRVLELGGPRVYSFRELMELLLSELERNDDDDGALRRHVLISLPFSFAVPAAFLADIAWSVPFAQALLGAAPLTGDQLILLRRDNIVNPSLDGFRFLGLTTTAPELRPAQLPGALS